MKQCARCQANLALGNVDVHPPRASRREKAIPKRLQSGWNRFRLGNADALRRIFTGSDREVFFHGTAWDWLSMLVGGLNQLRSGEKFATLWLGAWILLLVLSLLLIGTDLGNFLLGLLFAVHLASIGDLFFRQTEEWATRVRFTVYVGIVLGLIYFGSIRTIGVFARPLRFSGTTLDFQPEDVIWYAPDAKCSVGDVVYYITPTQIFNGSLGTTNANFRVEGARVSRMVAIAGQTVAWNSGILHIDGNPSKWQPGPTMSNFQAFEITVPEGYVFVLPENLLPVGARANIRDGQSGVIPKTALRGRVFARSYPWWNARWFPPHRD